MLGKKCFAIYKGFQGMALQSMSSQLAFCLYHKQISSQYEQNPLARFVRSFRRILFELRKDFVCNTIKCLLIAKEICLYYNAVRLRVSFRQTK